LFQAKLPIAFWDEFILTLEYLRNPTPSPILRGKTPYDVLYGTMSQVEYLRVFECLCYVHNQRYKGDKFASCKGVVLDYPYDKKWWRGL